MECAGPPEPLSRTPLRFGLAETLPERFSGGRRERERGGHTLPRGGTHRSEHHETERDVLNEGPELPVALSQLGMKLAQKFRPSIRHQLRHSATQKRLCSVVAFSPQVDICYV